MSLSITRNRSSIHTHGGGYIKIQEVNENGSDLSPRASVIDLGYLADSEIGDNRQFNDIEDETGDVVKIELGKRSVLVKGTLLQSSKGILDISDDVLGKYYRLYKYNGRTDNNVDQEIFYALGSVNPSVNLKFKGGTVNFEYRALSNNTDVSLDSTALTMFSAHASAPVAIEAKKFKKVVETAAT